MVGHFDDMFQFPGLLLHLGSQEEGGWCDGIPVKAGEWVKHVEAMHVHDGGVDGQLVTVGLELRKLWHCRITNDYGKCSMNTLHNIQSWGAM